MSERLDTLTSWHADWAGLRVVVAGLDQTAFSVVDTLAELGCDVLVAAPGPPEELARLVDVVGASLETDVRAASSFAPDVVIAPTTADDTHPVVAGARENGIAVWGDVEVAWRVRDKIVRADGESADWLLVAGSDGTDEIAHLAATMLVTAGVRAAPCGGSVPILDAVRDPAGFDALVVDLSAAQLALMAPITGVGAPVPHSAACVHADEETALDVVFRHARVACVYGAADERTLRMVEDADVTDGARAIGVRLGTPGLSELGVVEGILADRAFVADRRTSAAELATVDVLAERGLAEPRAVERVLAAAALARAAGAEPAHVAQALSGAAH
ncbi:hypothetical protein GCM10010915_24200 [Microbacterium faecale]|uniref:Uncharacterized protein n=2 Tax=Microbacterium faecale TaxID=1804630 RepID=A0A917DJK8_9MICO|nr:hypothetical protein GCM10010915_24200 [Microbacterium faecale]